MGKPRQEVSIDNLQVAFNCSVRTFSPETRTFLLYAVIHFISLKLSFVLTFITPINAYFFSRFLLPAFISFLIAAKLVYSTANRCVQEHKNLALKIVGVFFLKSENIHYSLCLKCMEVLV